MDELMLTVADYAERADLSARQVQRYLADGRLPGARKIRGKWLIPATARPSSYDVVPTSSQSAELSAELLPAIFESGPSLGFELWTLERAARQLETTVGGVERMAGDGLVTIGRYGPFGARRVVVR